MRYLLALLLLCGTAHGRPKLAVMSLQDDTHSLTPAVVDGLTDALRTQLTQSGQFVVIDKSRQAAALKQLVTAQKKESYRACYDSSCQIPLGQALAADSILRTKLTRVGSYDLMLAEMVDLARESVTTAAQTRIRTRPSAGREDRLLAAISTVVRQLTGQTTAIEPPPQVAPTPTLTPDEIEARRSAREQQTREQTALREQRRAEFAQQREEARRTMRIQQGRADVERSRRTRLVYGWTAIITGGIFLATGAYYMTARVSDARDTADSATTPEALQTAADDASKNRTTGIVITSIGAVTAGVGAILVLSAPSLRPLKVVQRLPRAGPTADGSGFALTWAGRF